MPGETIELKIALRGVTVGVVQTAIGWSGTVAGRPAVISVDLVDYQLSEPSTSP